MDVLARDAPISAVHAAMEKIGRERHAKRVNRVANHPDVLPFIKAPGGGPVDLAPLVHDPRNILLMGRYGGFMFHQISPGIYDAHVMVEPEGRGRWARELAEACFLWMFTKTDALEITASVPRGNVGASALARATGFRPTFVAKNGAHVLHLCIQDWAVTAPGLRERGLWMAERLSWAGVALTEVDDPSALRYMGLAAEMFLSGQAHKGCIFHHRWARLAGYGGADVVSENPVAISFRGATVVFQGIGEFYVVDGGTSPRSLNEEA